MGLNLLRDPLTYVVGSIVAVTGLVFASFVSCGISELIVRVSAWAYTGDPDLRARRRGEWLADIEDMSPLERPGHAGSFLWLSATRLAVRAVHYRGEPTARSRDPERLAQWRRHSLLAMTPSEFEHFTRQLFVQMGVKGWTTREAKDDGVDAVVTNEDPVRSGLCIVQAKKYRGAVGVGHVRELIGAIDNKRATKGILVTTSWVTVEGCELARRNGRVEIIDGENLKHLCQEHMGLDILTSLPKPPPRRGRD